MKLERNILSWERTLTDYSKTPILGTAVAIVKIGGGLTQMIAGLAVAIFHAIPSMMGDEDSLYKKERGVTHFIHGAGNVIRGLFETVFIVSIQLDCGNSSRDNTGSTILHTGQEDKFMAYQCLIDVDQRVRDERGGEYSYEVAVTSNTPFERNRMPYLSI